MVIIAKKYVKRSVVRSRCNVSRPREMSSPLYTVWDSLHDIIVGLFLASLEDSEPAMSFDMLVSLEYLFGLACLSLYKIPCDLHPRLPSEEFVMSDLLDDAIGVYHRIFDFSGVRIPFSSFLLALIKHYKVYFSRLGPLGLNKVVTFEKSGFFLIDRRDIPDYMSWRHPDSAINDLKPPAGVVDGNALVMGYHDFLCLPEWTGAEVQEEPHHDIRPTLQRLPFYCTPPAAVDAGVSDPTPEDLAAGNPSVKVVAKAEASQKRYASISGAISSHVAKRTSDDEDLALRFPLVTHIRSAAFDSFFREPEIVQLAPLLKFIIFTDSLARASMIDFAAASTAGVMSTTIFVHLTSGPYLKEDLFELKVLSPKRSWMPTHLLLLIPETKKVFKDPSVGKTMVNQFPTPGEMVRIEALSSDQLTTKMSVLHCLMMSHGGELLARYHGLLQSYHEYVQSTDSRLKGYQEKFASLTGSILYCSKPCDRILEAEKDEEILWLKASPPEFVSFFRGQFQGLVRKFLASDEFSRVQGELLSLAASVGFERGLSMHRTREE
ncbi:hypothetical protein Tco_0743728 [Tanacetum coccineum]